MPLENVLSSETTLPFLLNTEAPTLPTPTMVSTVPSSIRASDFQPFPNLINPIPIISHPLSVAFAGAANSLHTTPSSFMAQSTGNSVARLQPRGNFSSSVMPTTSTIPSVSHARQNTSPQEEESSSSVLCSLLSAIVKKPSSMIPLPQFSGGQMKIFYFGWSNALRFNKQIIGLIRIY